MEILHPQWPALAPVFHYHVTRFDGLGADPQGFLLLERALGTLTSHGICAQAFHQQPFTSTGLAERPSSAAFADALSRRLQRERLRPRFRRLVGASRLIEIREELRKEHPVAIGFNLPQSYPNHLNAKKEWLDPNSSPASSTDHCVLVLGFDDAREALRVQDSRGKPSEFDRGCWWLGYRVVDSPTVKEAYYLF